MLKRQQHLLRLQLRNKKVLASSETLKVPPISTKYGKDQPLVKMCGITSARDAAIAAEAGADFIGMIIWPKSKRSVSLATAKEISEVARKYGAEPVGVFVDDDVDTILRAAAASNIEYVQLHGNGSRSYFPQLVKENRVIYVLHSDKDGVLLNNISQEEGSLVDWILVDSATGGRLRTETFEVDSEVALPLKSQGQVDSNMVGWLLAGGIKPENAQDALLTLRPNGIDVSSGICAADGIKKDESRIFAFMNAVKSVQY
uniref:phosphoribosylanthranilate isomerase n=1 Tax=Chenopodium quinoa TaxID=63459 RepID=A0A803MFM1_CHEQI